MPNPFDLPGPPFLLLYACLGISVVAALRYFHRRSEEGPRPRIDTSDAYLIAYLRDGKNEAARVAVVSLIDRGLIKESGTDILAAAENGAEVVRRPLEKAVMALFARPQQADAIFKSRTVEVACREYENSLARQGLLPDAALRAQRRALLFGALLVLLGIAGLRIFVTLERGEFNIFFLLVMATVFTVLCARVGRQRRTGRGEAMLEDLRRLFARLEVRAPGVRPGGATGEAALLAAVFGIPALPWPAFAYAHRLFRKSAKPKRRRKSDGSSCGSSCGSGESSCGGGSGGGGCGGCGGS